MYVNTVSVLATDGDPTQNYLIAYSVWCVAFLGLRLRSKRLAKLIILYALCDICDASDVTERIQNYHLGQMILYILQIFIRIDIHEF